MRFNPIAPAANMRRITHPDDMKRGERFVPWFAADNDLKHTVEVRKAAYYENRSRVLNTGNNDPSVLAAAQQLLELQVSYLVDNYPDLYEIEEDFERGALIKNKTTGDTYSLTPDEFDLHPLAISGLLGQEDICIVEQMDDGRQVMVAGFLAAPTGWNLSEFVGLDMDGIHREVGDYFEPPAGVKKPLKHTVDKALAELPEYPQRQFARNNVFLGMNPQLALVPEEMPDIDDGTVTDVSSQAFLRSEYETLTRLPATERYPDNNRFIIFTIKPHVYSIADVLPVRGEALAKAIETNTVLSRRAKLAEKAIDYLTANEA